MIEVRGVKIDIKSQKPFHQVLGEIRADIYDVDRVLFAPGDVVIDVGAHIGIFSCYVAARFPQVEVCSLEPARETFSDLARNVSAFKNITAVRCGLSADAAPLRLQYRPDMNYSSSAHYRGAIAGAQVEMAPSIDLDSLIKQFGRVKFLKLDCEGAEWDALLASEHLADVEYLSVELHKMPQFSEKEDLLRDKLRRYYDDKRLRVHWVDKEYSEQVSYVGG